MEITGRSLNAARDFPANETLSRLEDVSSLIGVLVMAYGGPNHLYEVEPYLLDVRGHRPTAPEIIHEVRERYREIGGRSPILEQTQAQAKALEAALNVSGSGFQTFVGMRHWHPYIKDTLSEMSAVGIEKAVGLVMAPHFSQMSIGAYFKKVNEAGSSIEVIPIERWNLLGGYLDALSGRVRAALDRFPDEVRPDVPVIFTAHSLPERILKWGDPYPDELRATVAAVMERLGDQPHTFAYQSAAISDDPWLGPDAGEIIEQYASQGKKHLVIAPIGFVCEHVEVLYDVDIVFKQQAQSLDVCLERIGMVYTAPVMMSDLAQLIRSKAQESGWL